MGSIAEKSLEGAGGAPSDQRIVSARRRRSSLAAPYAVIEESTMPDVPGAWRLGSKLAFIVLSAAAAWAVLLGAFSLVFH
jgi:hypothetical protein